MTMQHSPRLFRHLTHDSLVKQIPAGLILGILLAWTSGPAAEAVGLLSTLFIGALKTAAPILVLVLVVTFIINHQHGQKTNIHPILFLYLLDAFSTVLAVVVFSFTSPSTLRSFSSTDDISPSPGIVGVIHGLIMSIVPNPINALLEGSYIGILVWAVSLGFALRHDNETTENLVDDMSNAVIFMVKLVIHFVPIDTFGLISPTLTTIGFSTLWSYAQLLMALVSYILLAALMVNPSLVQWKIHRSPFPPVLLCLCRSGMYAFSTRGSTVSALVNMTLYGKLSLDRDAYSISVPLGAAISMAGAAITTTVLTLAAVNTLGILVDSSTALLLSVVAFLRAYGAPGAMGGSLLLTLLTYDVFDILNDIAMQVAAVGFIIGVSQGSYEVVLDPLADVPFITAACQTGNDRLTNSTLRN